jgi:hypothetical protein
MKLMGFLCLALALAACSDDDAKAPEVVDCSAMAESECNADDACSAFYGTRIDVEAGCYGSLEMITCGPRVNTSDNNSPPGYVVSADGTCWFQDAAYFGDEPGYRTERDLPSGCAPVTGTCEPVDCTVMVETDCLGEPLCRPIYGSRLDETTMCYGPNEMMICGDAQTDCPNNVIGFVRGPDGACWSQASACYNIGQGYEPADDENPCPFEEPAECPE